MFSAWLFSSCPPWQDLLAQPAVKLNRESNCILTSPTNLLDQDQVGVVELDMEVAQVNLNIILHICQSPTDPGIKCNFSFKIRLKSAKSQEQKTENNEISFRTSCTLLCGYRWCYKLTEFRVTSESLAPYVRYYLDLVNIKSEQRKNHLILK